MFTSIFLLETSVLEQLKILEIAYVESMFTSIYLLEAFVLEYLFSRSMCTIIT